MSKRHPRAKFFKAGRRSANTASRWQQAELTITDLSHEGQGVARHQGRVVFVEQALPGEQVIARCRQQGSQFDRAGLQQLLSPSPDRVEPFCRWYQQCGGCSLQHLAPAAQLTWKQRQLQDLIALVNPQAELATPIVSEPEGFRHRLSLAVRWQDEQASWQLGLRQQQSRRMVPVDYCAIASPLVNAVMKRLPDMLLAVGDALPVSERQSFQRSLQSVEIDSDDQQNSGLLLRFSANLTRRALDRIATVCWQQLQQHAISAMTLQRAEGKKTRPQWRTLETRGELQLSVDGQQLHYQPGDFTQTNLAVNQQLLQRVLSWLVVQEGERVLELFAGIGNFSLPLAARTSALSTLELAAGMVARLQQNIARNELAEVSAGSADLINTEPVLPKADKVLLDPPRAGAELVCQVLAQRTSLRRVVYVSCHPATLQRDAQILQRGGLSLQKIAAVNMFPHSHHGEAVALFCR